MGVGEQGISLKILTRSYDIIRLCMPVCLGTIILERGLTKILNKNTPSLLERPVKPIVQLVFTL